MSLSFTVGERILCYHGPLVYEAKILKAETWDETNTKLSTVGPHFFVHYKGWKQTWDEWVPITRLLKFNDTNVQLQKALMAQASAAASTSGLSSKGKAHGGGTMKDSSSSRGGGLGRKDGRGTKRGREEDDSSKKPEMKLNVPEVLKVLLVDDWEAITKNSQLVSVPRRPTVVEILQEFKDYVIGLGKSTTLREPELVLPTIISGLQVYFDRSLGANLLYRFERPQYAEIRKQYVTGPKVQVGQEKDMSAIYGAEHLLRMLVSLPQMVASSTMDAESVGLVRDYVNELLTFMMNDRSRLFLTEYESSSLQYQNISRS
ncbi:MRG-domain-containing protein [Suillus subalutaceus]|uniref:MRG-domain-containing protein n=1 Tax=Suillus subalutaceus TaxID=48586 RepID=UPI001B86A7A8|nr:MRG-domain-containing protein [Suillus subalutaceus]KAG1871798.1 MRG-domain-containing protein [Suillus subalutaceus]KAG1879916.1 MRG-domain-containing protein [Suillus subluteus]